MTPTEVLRPAEIPAAGAALGFAVPGKVRRAADIPELRRCWAVATATGLVKIAGGKATAGPALETWPGRADDAVLAGWLAGLRATSIVESESRSDHDVTVLLFALLDLLAGDHPPTDQALMMALHRATAHIDTYGGRYAGSLHGFDDLATQQPLGRLFAVLNDFGATTGDSSNPGITPLGRWVLADFWARLPQPIEASLPASDVLSRLAELHDPEQAWLDLDPWLENRSDDVAARELLAAAEKASASERMLAVYLVETWGESMLPVWEEMVDLPNIGTPARAVLALWDKIPPLAQAERTWMVVERAAAALPHPGPDEALTVVSAGSLDLDLDTRIALVRDSGHPDAEIVARELTEFVASGTPAAIDQVLQLKVTLTGWRPPIWRRVLLPATYHLADLHLVIQQLFGWGGDHLHVFTVGERHYADTFFGLDGAGDENAVRVRAAFGPKAKKLHYLYDFGAGWRHEAVLEKVLERQADRSYPTCVAFSGASPQEYPDEDVEGDDESTAPTSTPFDLAAVNRRLAQIGDSTDDEDSDEGEER